MWMQKQREKKKEATKGLVAVAIDRDKGSQHALKWAADNLVPKGQTLILVHINKTTLSCGNRQEGQNIVDKKLVDKQTKDLFLTFHCYCTRKDIPCLDMTLEDNDTVKALAEFASYAALQNLVLGASSRHGFMRKLKSSDVPSNVSKAAPDFCTVYVISKGNKVSSVRNASRAAPYSSPLMAEIENKIAMSSQEKFRNSISFKGRSLIKASPRSSVDESMKPAYLKGRGYGKLLRDFSDTESVDVSFVSSGRPSVSTVASSSMIYELPDINSITPRQSTSSCHSAGTRLSATTPPHDHDVSFVSEDSAHTSLSCSSQGLEDQDSEMRRLKLELKKTMDMYSSACKEALAARQEAMELQRRTGMSVVDGERDKSTAAMKAAKRVAELDAHKRVHAELNVLEESNKFPQREPHSHLSYRRYTIEEIEEATDNFAKARKIGEGGYGPVFKCYLDHTPVAVKVLRAEAAQGRLQFQREFDVLSCIRHPHLVLLLGACPEYGILVYEHMAMGSLSDRMYKRGNTEPLTWQQRFRIAAEIATGLLFLHQTKPEPLVHRDLKPANILLDRNNVSKIGDVGLARLVPSIAENPTQCCVASAAGTLCYIDPEYQQTGMLGVKSDVYSFGIMLLELLTARKPRGLAYDVEHSMENGTFKDILDPTVPDWPLDEAMDFARLALKCSELRRKDRPDLGKVVLPELNRLREIAGESTDSFGFQGGAATPSSTSCQDEMSQKSDDPRTRSSVSSDSDKA